MIETLLVLAGVAALLGLAFLAPLVPTLGWLAAGAACIALGFAVGLPTAAWYHVRLRRSLAPRGLLPPRWWLRPVALHPHLTPEERPAVLRWFVAGGVGFVLVVIGIALTAVGVLAEVLRQAPPSA